MWAVVKSNKLCQNCKILVPDYHLVAHVGPPVDARHGWHAIGH
jgi:hypothetical protein